jgi:hypothetical protein
LAQNCGTGCLGKLSFVLAEDLAHFEQLKVFAAISARRVGKAREK